MSQSNQSHLDHQPATLRQNANNVNRIYPQGAGLVALAIDGANMAVAASKLGGVFDYRSAIVELTAGRPWIGTTVVLVERMTSGVARFVTALRRLGLSVITSHRAMVGGTRKAASDDLVLAMEGASYAFDPRVEELIVVSGDGDLSPLCEMGRRRHKRILVAGFRGTVSHKLVRAADEVVLLTERHVLARGEEW